MNQTIPRQSANLRLQRAPSQPHTNQEIKEPQIERRPDAGIEGCICLRDMMRIFCESCGHADEGNFIHIFLGF